MKQDLKQKRGQVTFQVIDFVERNLTLKDIYYLEKVFIMTTLLTLPLF